MPGTNAGTGQPISFRCWYCRIHHRRQWDHDGIWISGGTNRECGYDVRLTGYNKINPNRTNLGTRMNEVSIQYVCKCCNHKGWSAHCDMMRFKRRQVQ